MSQPVPTDVLCAAARAGFARLTVAPAVQDAALENLERWLSEPAFASYRAQIQALIQAERWATLVDSFYQVLPFGTAGRRGTVGVGPNRFNPWTLGASVQGHAAFLRHTRGPGPLTVVLANDVRRFEDLRGQLIPGVASPVMGLSSRDFAEIAAEVYAAADISVYLPADNQPMSTPELSFAIRLLGADGGLNLSASHNPPDDNGGKFYNVKGGQEVPPRDEQMAREVEAVTWVDRMPLDRARAAGMVREIGPEVHEAYIQANLALGRSSARDARVVFTALHGTGRRTVYALLQRAGFDITLEPTQAEYDGAFTNVPFRVPNPEVPRSMAAAVAQAEHIGADIVLACDPDADRLGLMVREQLPDPGSSDPAPWRFISGNEIAALIAFYALSHRKGDGRAIVFKTEVTSDLVARVARRQGARVVGDLLVGFKYIGDAIDQLDRLGRFGEVQGTVADFVLGAEESHGVLVTAEVRDKDAAGGALLLAELASLEKQRGRTLVHTLEDLWRSVGYVRNELVSTVMRGAEGRAAIQDIQSALRARPFHTIGNRKVTAFFDRQDPAGPFGPILSETDRGSRDVLVWQLGTNARVILRPSGTEPKNKIYVEVASPPLAEGASLSAEQRRMDREVRDLAEDFTLQMLALVGVTLPPWALRVSDLVAVEHKVHFADVVIPGVAEGLQAGLPDAELGRWIDNAIAPYGKDARGLVGEAARAWAALEGPVWAATVARLFPQ
jgi:phosphoglucomutase